MLIEKDWISFGHKFADRHGFDEEGYESHERSPVFFQFLDCVRMVLEQFPWAFQFNSTLLAFLADHCFSGWFTTFTRNSERERAADRFITGAALGTVWDAVRANAASFTNHLYVPLAPSVMYPARVPGSHTPVRVWRPSCVLAPHVSVRWLSMWHAYIHGWSEESKALAGHRWATFLPRPDADAVGGLAGGSSCTSGGRHVGLTLGASIAPKGGASHCSRCNAEFIVIVRPQRSCKQCQQHVCTVKHVDPPIAP